MNNNICEKCKTENEQQYKYCKNCGAALNASPQQPEAQPNPVYNQNNFNNGFFTVDNFDGVTAEEMAIFVGKKSENILPKFSKMQISGSKASWTWPAAILGYIFGPLGSALWFFYRKMYKPAVIFALIGAVITIITGIMTVNAPDEAFLDSALESFTSGDFGDILTLIEEEAAKTTTAEKVIAQIASLINEFSSIAACIVSGVFGLYIYKQHAISKITNYKTYQADSRFYKIGLASIGGYSGGMLAVGIIIMLAADTVVEFVTSIFALL